MNTNPILQFDHVFKSFEGNPVFTDFSLTLTEGSRTAVLGASGRGKTTLFNLILGLTSPDKGSVLLTENLQNFVVFQEDRLFERYTGLENLDVFPKKTDTVLARAILSRLGLGDAVNQPVSQYSGGMKRRTAIARALYGCLQKEPAPSLLLLDEPFKGLNPGLKWSVLRYVAEVLIHSGSALLFVTHDKEEAAALGCDLLNL